MKLLRANFQNFRMLRDIELDFSHNPKKKLTVIRAANESGKTTILHGLQWALYGDKALPGEGTDFRLYPIDWSAKEGRYIKITATVEFELTKSRLISGKNHETSYHYRIIRSALEDLDSTSRPRNSTVKLFQVTDAGDSPVSEPEAVINDELPLKLREVFFTDGDRALSFIEADAARSAKRQRVQQAIHSLLGLEVIEAATRHVRKSEAEVNRKAKRLGGDSELNTVATKLEDIENERETLEDKLENAKQQFAAFDEECIRIDRKISAALEKGDKEELSKELNHVRGEIKQLAAQREEAKKDHSNLFCGQSIATSMLSPVLSGAYDKLDELHDQGKIPNITIPLLEDRLQAKVCICGETLKLEDLNGERRRAYIQKLIKDSQESSEIQKIITELYFGTKPILADRTSGGSIWLRDLKKVIDRRDYLQAQRDKRGREFRRLEMELASLPDTDIRGLRETLLRTKEQRDRFLTQKSVNATQLENLDKERKHLELKLGSLLHQKKKGERLLAERDVTQDIIKVLKNAFGRISHEELGKVSNQMNSIFLKMIGADPEQGAIIQRTEISREFDIIVYGPDDRKLNPDRDLNGASRRALTLAFILALTKVSEVAAPNVIDTPLGMMSGYVKRSILRTVIRESTQLILFLTHDEINGCEDIIDEAAGLVYTLTNPTHYPKMLINDPGVSERKVLRCDCDHNSTCALCMRRLNPEIELEISS